MRRSSTLLSFSVAASLICTPLINSSPAHAGPLLVVAPADGAADDPALTEAKALYKEGEVKFQTADYEDALALWKKAFGMLPDGDETRGMRHALVYNIAEAHSRAYEVTRNPTHLRKAKILLDNYRADHRAFYGDDPEAIKERAEVDDRITELDKMIADSEAAGETPAPIAEPIDDGTQTTTSPDGGQGDQPRPSSPKQQWDADLKADPVYGPMWKKSSKRIVAGGVMSGIGIPFVLGSILLFIGAPNNDFGSGLAFGGAAAAGVIGLGLLIPGAVILGKGLKQRKEVLAAKPKPVGYLLPTMVPGGGGVSYTLRF